uniref:FYVE-type domain-containing protein n=2 Tax=Phytophthora ramorum TaxID=164328 RepID=H3GH32_PHYRM
MRRRSSLGGSDDRASRVSERFTNPFAPLSLSSEAVSGLEALAQTLVARNVDAYERHLHGGAQVDKTRWKLLYERGGLRSYAERGSADLSFGFGAAFGAAAGHLDRPVLTQSSRASVPSVLVLGSIEGELDDTMYGFMCPTLDQMRVKTSYVKDGLARGSVLATLVSPTVEDPFTSVAVKWMEKGQPAHARAVVKNRDYVYLEATGVEYLRNGERVGYQVVHSIQFPETPVRASAIRGNMSICAFYRQRNNDETEVYVKGFLNPVSGLENAILTRSVARTLLSVSRNVYCCQMKKIKWAIRQRYRSASVDSQTALAQDSRVDGPCVTCGKKRSAFSSLVATAARRMTTGKNFKWRRRCKLCERYVCPDCRSLHKLTFVLPDHRLVQQQVALCTDCRGNALSVKAVDVARDELKRRRSSLYEWRDTYATSTSSNPVAIDELN